MTFSTHHARWQAVRARDPSAHSSFVYAVTTTRIYCRPTCPARLARRANVVFFDTSGAAVASGYRPCKRCAPDSGAATSRDRQREAVRRACEILQQSRGASRLKDVARQVGLSPRYFHAVFKQRMGITPAQYAKDCSRTEKDGVDLSATTLPSPAPGTTNVTADFSTPCGVDMNTLAFGNVERELSELAPTGPGAALPGLFGMLRTDDFAMAMSAEAGIAISLDGFDDTGVLSQFLDLNAYSVDIDGCLDTSLSESHMPTNIT